MTFRLVLAVMAATPLLVSADTSLAIRGRPQSIALLPSARDHDRAVLFLPGDGGWRGLAITIAQTICQWGYDVYGFDTKRYLEGFTGGDKSLSADEMRQDLRQVIDWVRSGGARSITVLGWSQGAGMAVLAARERPTGVDGVLTLGLPESAVLGWNWKDSLAVLARREPDEPHFPVRPHLPAVSPTPLWMIHGSLDEYTTPAVASSLYAVAKEPKRIIEIEGGNHRFDGRRDQLFQALREGLEWVRSVAR
jgi:dienelactone hydrolase